MDCPFYKEIKEMKEKLKRLKMSEQKREDWLRDAKKKAGYD